MEKEKNIRHDEATELLSDGNESPFPALKEKQNDDDDDEMMEEYCPGRTSVWDKRKNSDEKNNNCEIKSQKVKIMR